MDRIMTKSSRTALVLLLVSSASGFFPTAPTSFVGRIVVGAPPDPRLLPWTQQQQPSRLLSPSTLLFARRGGNNRRDNRRNQVEELPPMNDEINAPELRVLLNRGQEEKDEALGILSRADALDRAKTEGLDLILINDKSDPPVCKIVNYEKYKYSQSKKAKEVKKNAKASEVKEVKMSYKIDKGDYSVRKNSAEKFLKQGNRVKATVMFRGREIQHDNIGYDLLGKLSGELKDIATAEGRPKKAGRTISLFLAPRQDVIKAVTDSKKADEKAKKAKKKEELKKKADERSARAAELAAIKAEREEINGNVASTDGSSSVSVGGFDPLSLLSSDGDADLETSLDELLGGGDDVDDLFS